MKQDIKVNKISYVMEFSENSTAQQTQISNLHKLKLQSLVENSYNSITLINVHNNNYSYQYNYLMYIDENGKGYPLNGVIHASEESNTINPYSVQPGVIIDNITTTEVYGQANTNTIQAQNEIIEELSNAITNIVNLLNNSSVATALGIDNNANTDASQYIDNATAAAQTISQRYSAIGNWSSNLNPPTNPTINPDPGNYTSQEMGI